MVHVLEINIQGLDPTNTTNAQSRVIAVDSWRKYINYYRNYKGKAAGFYEGTSLDSESITDTYSGYILPRLCQIDQLFCDNKQLCCVIETCSHMCFCKIAQLLDDGME